MIDRRSFLRALAAAGVSRALPGCAQAPAPAGTPFALGVASGYPHPGGMVLWTRLVGDLGPADVPVRWEIADDEGMRRIVASGTAPAEAVWAHSARVEARGLEPDRWYWYRFMTSDAVSTVGRTRTAPRADASPASLRFALGSCQQYEQGYYGAHRHIAADSPDLVAFVGDYIYESSWGKDHVRQHTGGEPYTLDEYRARYALYKSDPDLQAAHAACPWILTWDDHEVDNDYANDRPEDGMPREKFLLRRAAAYRAFYEHQPLPERMRPDGPAMRVHTQLGWGTLGRFYLLDDRQYRWWQACVRRGRSGGSNTVDVEYCPSLEDPRRSILGPAQERWLDGAFAASGARWNLLAQQTRMAQFDQRPGPGRRAWTDGWDGYPAARRRLLDSLAARQVANPVVLGGDVHLFNVCDLKRDFDDPASPVVASEFVGTSITSQAPSQARLERLLPDNPHMKLIESRYRGYVRVEVTQKSLRADLRAMESVQTPDAACRTLATFVVEDGRPGPQRA
ncbi:MAG TPA: alkaline phosphatase D family protein [Burkholderiales bacterium]|nr:alkaline phosphatase D family protein [Burkholderiales bacterium]